MITYSGYTIRGQVKKIMSRTEFHAICIHQLLPGNIQQRKDLAKLLRVNNGVTYNAPIT